MAFKLHRGSIVDILKDKVTTSFGFGTKKERMDYNLEHYELRTINNVNEIMAQRNMVISHLNAQITAFDQILKPMDEYLSLFKKIEDYSLEEITKPNSKVILVLYNLDGSIFASGNYYSLNSTIKVEKDPNNAVNLTQQLMKKKEMKRSLLIEKLIVGRGVINLGKDAISNSDIYTNFRLMQNLAANYLLNPQRQPYNFAIMNFGDASILKSRIEQDRNNLFLNRNNINLQLQALNSATAADKHTLDLIEASKKLITTSPEYVAVKASDEYLKGKK